MAEDGDFEAVVRRSWAALLEWRLPEAAAERGWPVAGPDGFRRALLDHVCDGPWERACAGAAVGAVPILDLVLAVELAERAIAGEVDLAALDRRSREWRAVVGLCAAVPDPAKAEALAREAGIDAADLVAGLRALAERVAARRG
jgi:hypothetical protein